MPTPSSPDSALGVGRRVATALRRAWWWPAGALAGDDLEGVSDLLQDAGLSGLVWPALGPAARRGPVGREFRRSALADTGMSTRLDGCLVEVVKALRRAGVEPLVPKGWAVARYYPDPSARPYSDIDLAVRPDQAEAARTVLGALGQRAVLVDLHVGLPDLPERSWDDVFARSRQVLLDDYPIRVLAPEDQFRWLAVHLVRHVVDRPRWLLDLAVLMEQAGDDLDWAECLRGGFVWRRWILAVVGLAGRLLGARVPEELRELPGCRPPGWLEEITLWRWGKGDMLPARAVLHRPAEWWPYVAYRLLSPVRWSYRLGLPPVEFLPPVWAVSVLGACFQHWPKWWRRLVRDRGPRLGFATHERRTF